MWAICRGISYLKVLILNKFSIEIILIKFSLRTKSFAAGVSIIAPASVELIGCDLNLILTFRFL